MKRFYGGISLLVIFLLLTAGSWYIDDRTNHIAANEEIMISWFIYTTSTVLNLYYSYYNALLVGRGLVKENNQLIIITRSTYLVLAALGLIAGYGLIAVATANFLSIIIYFMGKCQKKWIKQFGWIFCPKRQFAFHIYVFTSGNSCQLWSNR